MQISATVEIAEASKVTHSETRTTNTVSAHFHDSLAPRTAKITNNTELLKKAAAIVRRHLERALLKKKTALYAKW